MRKYDYNDVCHKAAMELSQQSRQQFMNCIWHGSTIGESREVCGISFEAALGIMNMNLVKNEFLTLNKVSA